MHLAAQQETMKLVDDTLEVPNWVGAAFCLDPFWVGQAHQGPNAMECLRNKEFDAAQALRDCIPMLAPFIEKLPDKEEVFAFLEPFLDCRAPYNLESYPKTPCWLIRLRPGGNGSLLQRRCRTCAKVDVYAQCLDTCRGAAYLVTTTNKGQGRDLGLANCSSQQV